MDAALGLVSVEGLKFSKQLSALCLEPCRRRSQETKPSEVKVEAPPDRSRPQAK